jgi:TM2 domain-containing membrane protein YozV
MSELVPSQSPAPPPGWYVDATGHQRWWDGATWGVYAPTATAAPALVRTAKDSGIAYLLAILLGGIAAHHFYLNRPGSAIGWLVLWWGGWATTGLGVGLFMLFVASLWWILDLFLIPSYVRAANEKLRQG